MFDHPVASVYLRTVKVILVNPITRNGQTSSRNFTCTLELQTAFPKVEIVGPCTTPRENTSILLIRTSSLLRHYIEWQASANSKQ